MLVGVLRGAGHPDRHSLISKILSRLTYANVMATVAVFLSLGGGAYAIALAKNSVKSRHIAPNAVRSPDIKNRAVRGVDVRTNSITGANVRESTLGPIPRAARADTLDGQDSSAFLGVNGKAADANTLDSKDSSEFLGSTAKAVDAQLLDGVDSLNFTRLAGRVEANGTLPPGFSGYTVTKLAGPGQYFVNFPTPGTFGSGCNPPIAMVIPTTSTLRFATIAGTQCSADGSGGFTVETYDDDGPFTPVDTQFAFMAR